MTAKKFAHDGETFVVGEMVTCDVPWKDGRRTNMRGKLITIAGDEVFIETDVGPVAGDLSTLEKS